MNKIKPYYGRGLKLFFQSQPRFRALARIRQPIMIQSDESWILIDHESVNDIRRDGVTHEDPDMKAGHNDRPKGSQISFPPEIWHLIIEHAASMSKEYGDGDASKYTSGKVKMRSLQNLATVSWYHRRVVITCWAHTLHLREQGDMAELRSLMMNNNVDALRCVRRLVCEDSYQVYRAPKNAFDAFEFLEELILDCHSDINFGGTAAQQQNLLENMPAQVDGGDQVEPAEPEHPGNNAGGTHHALQEPQPQPQPQPRMSYRRLRVKLPKTLRTLRIYHSHVPDIYFIQHVADECPRLRSLTLARCTIFTCAQCKFWEQLPRTESDAYFSSQGVAAYAAALGKELKRIKNLEEIKIGIYLTDHAAVDMHLTEHAGLDVSMGNNLAVWGEPCEQCVHQYHKATIQLEQEATAVLAKEISTLRSVSWASFCSDKRIGWNTHPIMQDTNGQSGELTLPVIQLEQQR